MKTRTGVDRIRGVVREGWKLLLRRIGRVRFRRSTGRTTRIVRPRSEVCVTVHSTAREARADLSPEALAIVHAADERVRTARAFTAITDAVDRTAAIVAGGVEDRRGGRAHLFVIHPTVRHAPAESASSAPE